MPTLDAASLESLAALLEQEEAVYAELVLLLEEERTALLAMAAERLAAIVARKETLALRLKALDESRKLLAQRLGRSCGLDPASITVSALCAAAPRAAGERLAETAARLRAVVERCRDLQRVNAAAAGRGAELVRGLIEHLIAQADPAGKVYRAPARGRAAAYRAGAAGFVSRHA